MGNLKVGDTAVHVERLTYGSALREIRLAKIVRETKTQWVDDLGAHWRKRDGAMVPQYLCPRFLMSIDAFLAKSAPR